MKEISDFLLLAFHPECHSLKALAGYANLNFSFQKGDDTFILKTYPFTEERLQSLEAENKLLHHLTQHHELAHPEPIAFADGSWVKTEKIAGVDTLCRILTYLPGTFLGDSPASSSLYAKLGIALSGLDLKLSKHTNLGIQGRQQAWDLQNFHWSLPAIQDISEPSKQKIIRYFFQQFDIHVAKKLPFLRKQLIHGDANEWNILVENEEVTGLIDFGDACFSPVINEVAIALTYLIYDKEKPLDWTDDFLKGYHSRFPLLPEELEILYYLIAARLCTSVCQSAQAKKATPDNPYLSVSEQAAWDTLHKWIVISPLFAENHFRKALGLPPKEELPVSYQWQRRKTYLSPILSVSYKNPLAIQGSAFQYFYDSHGNTVLDAYNNIPHVGHCHPHVVEAGQKQMALLNTNTRYLYDALPAYAEKLLSKFPPKLNRVFFVNSGSAASDLALRMATAHTGNSNVMVVEHGYHGNTQKSIDISDYKFSNKKGQGQKSNILKAALPDTYRAKFPRQDTIGISYAQEAIKQMNAFGEPVGAFIAEPIVGCGGQVPLAAGYLEALYPAIREQGGVCISDEVQTGFGRIGAHFWGFEAQGVVPDLVILGKPMGNGHPMGAVVCTQAVAESFEKGVEFFSSFGGNPVSCEIGKAVLEVIEQEELQRNAWEVGNFYKENLTQLAKRHPSIGDVRGSGLFLGVELIDPETGREASDLAAYIKNHLRDRHVLISTDGPFDSVLKTKPPLCFTKENAIQVVEALDQAFIDFYNYQQSGQ